MTAILFNTPGFGFGKEVALLMTAIVWIVDTTMNGFCFLVFFFFFFFHSAVAVGKLRGVLRGVVRDNIRGRRQIVVLMAVVSRRWPGGIEGRNGTCCGYPVENPNPSG